MLESSHTPVKRDWKLLPLLHNSSKKKCDMFQPRFLVSNVSRTRQSLSSDWRWQGSNSWYKFHVSQRNDLVNRKHVGVQHDAWDEKDSSRGISYSRVSSDNLCVLISRILLEKGGRIEIPFPFKTKTSKCRNVYLRLLETRDDNVKSKMFQHWINWGSMR